LQCMRFKSRGSKKQINLNIISTNLGISSSKLFFCSIDCETRVWTSMNYSVISKEVKQWIWNSLQWLSTPSHQSELSNTSSKCLPDSIRDGISFQITSKRSKMEQWLYLLFFTACSHFTCILVGYVLSLPNVKVIPTWWWLWLNYIVAALFATFTHMAGHFHWSGRWFRAHTIEHHTKLYPPKRFINEKTLGADDGNIKYYLPTILFPFIFSYFIFGDTKVCIITGVHNLLWFALADYLHDSYHKKGHCLEKYSWFMVLRELHFLHHKGNMLHNYGIMDFFTDWLAGSLAIAIPA